MHDCGLLGQMFPEFKAISCRVVRDFYHKYTVDEHTLLTIRNLERLLTPATPSRARFGSLLADLADARTARARRCCFHDVGKWRDDDHAIESVRMAGQMFDRLDLPAAARETVAFLIRQHLADVARRVPARHRGPGDRQAVRRRSSATEERLKMLCLMTLADVEAVSPDTLTPWKEELLWRLYVDTYNHLTLRTATS